MPENRSKKEPKKALDAIVKDTLTKIETDYLVAELERRGMTLRCDCPPCANLFPRNPAWAEYEWVRL